MAAIDWTPKYGAIAVDGPIATLFASKGWEQNGEAISSEIDLTATGGAYQYFRQRYHCRLSALCDRLYRHDRSVRDEHGQLH